MSRFSIITICRNAEGTIEKTIQSLISQSYRNYEYIVINGNSTDGTLDIIEKYEDNIDVLITEPDKGIYDAMNKGISYAKGEFVYFLNSGDTFYDADVLSDVATTISRNVAIDAIIGDVMLINIATEEKHLHSHFHEDNFSLIIKPFNHQSIFARRTMFDEVGVFNIQYRIYADFDWIIRSFLLSKHTYVKYNRFVCNYLIGGVSSQTATGSLAPDRLIVLKKNFNPYAINAYIILRRFHLARVLKVGFIRNVFNKCLAYGS